MEQRGINPIAELTLNCKFQHLQRQHWHLAWQINECSEHSGRSVCAHLAGCPCQVPFNRHGFKDAIDSKGNVLGTAVALHTAIVCLGVGRKIVSQMLTDSNTAEKFCLGGHLKIYAVIPERWALQEGHGAEAFCPKSGWQNDQRT